MNPTQAPGGDGLCWRELTTDDLDAIEVLHRRSMGREVRPEVVKPESRDFFAGILGGRGRAFGVFEDDLVAYGILQFDLLPTDDPRPALGLAQAGAIAKLAGAAVDPAYRGRGLQRRLIAVRVAAAAGIPLLFSTAAPLNLPSWTNLLAAGFTIRAIVTRYGGLTRYLMVRTGEPLTTGEDVLVNVNDLDRQRELLARGWEGVASRASGGQPVIVFAPSADTRG